MAWWKCNTRRQWNAMLLLGVLLAGVSLASGATAETTVPAVTTVPHEGFNLLVQEMISPTYAVVKLTAPVQNWFAGTLTNLPTTTDVTIGFSMDGNATPQNPANVTKWQGLRAVMTYADPTQYASYISYHQDAAGVWIADDPCRTGDARAAGTGVVPAQTVIPAADALAFLSADGTTWSPWREIEATTILPKINIVRLTQRFTQPTATIAMRVPYSYTYQQALLERIAAMQYPGIAIDEVGVTPAQRTLQVIRLEPPHPDTAPADRPTILVYAREHATEPDGSWVIQGMLAWLLSDVPAAQAARQQCDWLLIPLLDPDQVAASAYTSGDLFSPVPPDRPEAVAFAAYLVNWVDAGHRLEMAINLHNVECNEGPNLFSPLMNEARKEILTTVYSGFWTAATQAGFTTGQPRWSMVGYAPFRLSGWCFRTFRTMDLFFEINGRAPANRLSLPQLQQAGRVIAQQCVGEIGGTLMAAIRAEINAYRQERECARTTWWQRTGRTPATRTRVDTLQGY